MKALQALFLIALLLVSTWGLSGDGPLWSRYVGAGMVLALLMLILQSVSNLPTATDLQKAVKVVEDTKPVIDADELDATEARHLRVPRN